MSTTRTPGITIHADGRRFIDKRHLGVRISLHVGAVTQDQAEQREVLGPVAENPGDAMTASDRAGKRATARRRPDGREYWISQPTL